MPSPIVWVVLAFGAAWAVLMTYHELRVKAKLLEEVSPELTELNQWIDSGRKLRARLFETPPSKEEAQSLLTAWAKGAASTIEEHWSERTSLFWNDADVRPKMIYRAKPPWFSTFINWTDARLIRLVEIQRENSGSR